MIRIRAGTIPPKRRQDSEGKRPSETLRHADECGGHLEVDGFPVRAAFSTASSRPDIVETTYLSWITRITVAFTLMPTVRQKAYGS